MDKKSRRKFIGSLLALWCLFGVGALFLFWELSQSDAALTQIPNGLTEDYATGTPASLSDTAETAGPARLLIPTLNINANIQHVGLTQSGAMGVPIGKYKWDDVGWYKFGPKPGDIGNAVIDGHVDDALSLHAVFYNLHNIQNGDEIDVKDAGGTLHRFKVVGKQIYYYNSAPLDQIFGSSDKARLVLITCYGGVWVPSIRSYDRRLVVYAELQ
jgi:sortase A